MKGRGIKLGQFVGLACLGVILVTGFGGCAKSKAMISDIPKPPAGSVRFTVVAPRAKKVFLVGSFNGWAKESTPMKVVDGAALWWIDVPLREGEYTFMYLIDGVQWITPPSADDFVTDNFGHTNGVVIVR